MTSVFGALLRAQGRCAGGISVPDTGKTSHVSLLHDEPLSLLGCLIERMRRSLSVKYLERSEHGAQIADRRHAGESNGMRLRTAGASARRRRSESTVDELGRMLMSFEGWQFRVEMCDRSEGRAGS
jgi:hypothetical protein